MWKGYQKKEKLPEFINGSHLPLNLQEDRRKMGL
jgi:hypothetical protein